MCALIWVALDAGKAQRGRPERSQWSWMPHILWGAIFLQCLLGALVAGNDAGLVNTDWPLMSGKWFPGDYAAASVWATIAHSIAAVQFHHRILAYGLMLAAALLLWKLPYGWKALRPLAWTSGRMLAFMILFQAVLGILTLMLAVPIGLGIAHQLMAALVLSTATVFLWASRA
jgi:cytochrome c oxidase assembly protein subunit 15